MRTSFLLLSAALVLTACDDAAETTGPRSLPVATPATAAALPPGPNTNAKQVPGFTTVTTVESVEGVFGGAGNAAGWLSSGTISMTCPAGTQVIGGGYEIFGTAIDMKVYTSKPNATNGWNVQVEHTGSAQSVAFLKVTAICIK